MRGHLVKRSENSWSVVLSLGNDPSTGKRVQQWVTVQGTKKDAERRLTELLHSLETGGYVKPDRVTVNMFLHRWLRDYVSTNTAPSTALSYRKNHPVPMETYHRLRKATTTPGREYEIAQAVLAKYS